MESHGRAKAKADGDERALVFVFKPVERGKDIAGFRTAVVRALAQAGAAEVEAQHGKPKSPLRDR